MQRKNLSKVNENIDLVEKQAEKIHIEFSADEEIYALIEENTHNSKHNKSVNNIYKLLAMIAGGTSFRRSCKLTGISPKTLTQWRSKEWYNRAIELIRIQLYEQLDGKLTHVLNKGISRLNDRLDKGDPVVQRDGSIIYKPVSAKDAAVVSSIFFDKRNLLRNKPTSITSSQSTDERLDKLAQRFRDIATTEGEYYEISEEAFAAGKQEQSNDEQREQTQTVEQVCDSGTSGRELEQDLQRSEERPAEERFTFKVS